MKVLLFAKVSPLHGTTKVIDIYNNLVAIVDAYGGFEKCACIGIDGTRVTTGRRNRLVGILKDLVCAAQHFIALFTKKEYVQNFAL